MGKGQESSRKRNSPGNKNNTLMLIYRWIIFLFSLFFSLICYNSKTQGYAVLESLAIVFIYNVAITAYYVKSGKRCILPVIYSDAVAFMLLIFFSGGIESELYVFLFFLIGLCGIYGNASNTLKIGITIAAFYTSTCILAGSQQAGAVFYTALVIRFVLVLMAAFAVTRINIEVRKSDELIKKEFRIARTDKLTGLANRHYFEQKVKDEVEYAVKSDSVLNVLMFDIDNFKGFNDTYGHVSGDKLLALFSNIILQCIRKSDIPVRYGGEEFVILIRDLDIIIARSVGDRIRRQLEKQRIYLKQYDVRQKVTVSCGIAQFPVHSKNIKEVIEKADQALYYAKSIGKNIVVIYDEIGKSREALEKSRLDA